MKIKVVNLGAASVRLTLSTMAGWLDDAAYFLTKCDPGLALWAMGLGADTLTTDKD